MARIDKVAHPYFGATKKMSNKETTITVLPKTIKPGARNNLRNYAHRIRAKQGLRNGTYTQYRCRALFFRSVQADDGTTDDAKKTADLSMSQ